MNWKKYGIVIASEYRKKVIKLLKEKPKTPKQLSIEMKVYLSHISATLRELSNNGIVKCLTPELNKGRLYKLTAEGEEIAKRLEG